MLRLKPKTKERRSVSVPAKLRDAMQEVLWLIQGSRARSRREHRLR